MSTLLTNAVRNWAWTGIGSVGNAVLSFAFAGVTIRWLGPAEAGFVIAVTTIAGINAGLADLGIGTAATRLIARAHSEGDALTFQKAGGICSLVTLAFGALGMLLLSLGAPWIVQWARYGGDHKVAIIYCVLAGSVFLLSQVSTLFVGLLVAAQRFDWSTKLNLGLNCAQGLCGIIFLRIFPSVLTVGITYVTLAIIGVVLRGWAVKNVFKMFPWPRWDRGLFVELWKFGRWMYVAQMTRMLSDGLDKIVLVAFFGSATLPFYSFAQRMYVMVHGLLVNQAAHLFPMLSAQGANLEAVAERTEERVRWFIGLIAGLVYASLIIAGPALLTVVVNAEFSATTSFQVLIFSFVGYVHAQSIVPYFYNLSKGDAKGNSIYQMLVGFGILPALLACAYFLGQQYAVLGQLMILGGVLYLAHRGYTGHPSGFVRWFFKPLHSSLALMVVAAVIHFGLTATGAGLFVNFLVMVIFNLIVLLSIARIERFWLNGAARVETLGRGLSIICRKLGFSPALLFQILAIPNSTAMANAASSPIS